MSDYKPETTAQIIDILQEALAEKSRLKIEGAGTKPGLGPVIDADDRVSLEAHKDITDYQPEELVITARSGTRLDEIEAVLSKNNQILAFEPPHLDKFYGTPHAGTIGGIIAANLSGPRRISAGAARDYLLGFDGVSGRASYFHSGSKVMKNVTGYDLSKLICGSFGRLAVLSEMTLKLLPRPELAQSLIVACSSLAGASQALIAAFGSACDPSGGSVLALGDGRHSAYIRIEGVALSVKDRLATLSTILQKNGDIRVMEKQESADFWQKMRDIDFFDGEPEQIWKVSMPPSSAPAFIGQLITPSPLQYALDWAGGLVWLGGEGDTLGPDIRQTLLDYGGHASLMRGPEGLRQRIDVFQPPPPALGALHERIKTAFDPRHILNPYKGAR